MKFRKCLGGDRRGQMFMLEVLSTGLLLLAAVNFITTLPPPTQESNLYLYRWALTGKDVFTALDNMPSSEYCSLLDEGVCRDFAIVVDELNSTLPMSRSFNIYLRNTTSELTLHHSGSPDTASSGKSHYITYLSGGFVRDFSSPFSPRWVEIDEGVYEISIVIWHEVRGVTR